MSIIRVKRFAQVTLPPELRKPFNLEEGDYLEAVAVEDGILLKPVAVVERKHAWKDLFDVVDRVAERTPKPKRSARRDEEDIARIIKDERLPK
ncbi:MAG: AbrB/MazE/SpoVT family DNA-binding domain-containing protein [Acidobacteria bacterium]|nr:AbrB/MazE/SpoVT family DNA-binding domain-containing protein [Acidobacteriota bacterium]MCW5968051.1 AbrB/MazE/SpoVT family DNA-binding domain-containing protein [Blastocatellales bacterium]